MPQATKSTIVIQPTLVEINHISFSGDFSDVSKVVVSLSATLKDATGESFKDMGISIPAADIPALSGILTAIDAAIVPKLVAAAEADLGVTFA